MSSVAFDDSFITKVYIEPARTLAEYDSIWGEEVFTLVSDWYRYSGEPVDHAAIKDQLSSLEEQRLAERMEHPVVRLRDKIISRAPSFQREVFPRISSLLPPDTKIEATTSLVSLIKPGAFCAAGRIVVNLSNPQFLKAGDDLIFNVVAHELYHFGFHGYQEHGSALSTDASPGELMDHALWWLQNEGMATYASYGVTDLYPAHGAARDYDLLDDPTDVRRLIGNVNEILDSADRLPRDAFRDLIWEKGVRERAFYVVGAHMARTIDSESGRGVLISLIEEGSRSFAEAYNGLAPEGTRIEI